MADSIIRYASFVSGKKIWILFSHTFFSGNTNLYHGTFNLLKIAILFTLMHSFNTKEQNQISHLFSCTFFISILDNVIIL